jgi:hypothetical protein
MATILDGTSVPDDGIKAVNFKVATDLSTKQYYAVKASADRTVALASVAGADIVGILQDAPNGSSTATVGAVKCLGISLAIAGGTCTVGGLLTVTSAGKFVDNTGSDKEAAAICLEGTTTDTDQILVNLVHSHVE